MRHGQLDASDIEVAVENGDVTLEGSVEDRRMKRLAEDIAASVPGVDDVHNRLRLSH
jgi:osmotically-inducible protein OsmY